jgi:hypothetical protein
MTGFYGRGYSQLTWNYNYQKFSILLKTDYFNNPDLVLTPLENARIIAYGMKNGTFTGKKLEDFINKSKSDFLGARLVMDNDTSQAKIFADIAQKILDTPI